MSAEVVLLFMLFFSLSVALVLIFLSGRQLHTRLEDQLELTERLRDELRAVSAAGIHMGERIRSNETAQDKLEEKIQQLTHQLTHLHEKQVSATTAAAPASSYEQAVKLAKKGATVDELTEICNITRGEAELVAMMQRYDRNGGR